jgi:Cytochrome C oxidase, cbb3-type, subunit III
MPSEKSASSSTNAGSKSKVLGIFVVFFTVAIAGGTVLYSLSGWSAPARMKNLRNPFPTTPEALVSARNDYAAHCQSCHGANGDGKGDRADRLSIAPADFGDAHAMGLRTDGELFWMITEGHKPMPAFRGTMTEEQRWHLVDYVRTFAHK